MPERPARGRWWRWRVLGAVAAILVVGWSLRTWAYQVTSHRAYFLPTSSMAPTLARGRRILVDEGINRDPRRGEVWVFVMPAAANVNGNAVKRVIGLPGDTVEVRSGQVLINGQPLAEPYLAAPPTYTMAPRTLGPADYFMLGDSRDASNDSHVWGPVRRELFLGLVRMRVWPIRRAGGL